MVISAPSNAALARSFRLPIWMISKILFLTSVFFFFFLLFAILSKSVSQISRKYFTVHAKLCQKIFPLFYAKGFPLKNPKISTKRNFCRSVSFLLFVILPKNLLKKRFLFIYYVIYSCSKGCENVFLKLFRKVVPDY